jgi:GT2 family glycosyltransferase
MWRKQLRTLAVIVNYHSAPLTLGAVRSVLDSKPVGSLRVVVVDNSVAGETEILRRGLPSDVFILASPENIGFGKACNLAFDRFPAEAILLLNPDGRLLAGGLEQLQETLFSRDRNGAVSPRVFWDNGLRFQLPPSLPPALFEFDSLLHAFGPRALFPRIMSGFWRRYSVKMWEARMPVGVRNLSGGAVLLKSSAVKKAGGLFDPRFFLYFEDTDLFIRLRKAGFALLMEPRAAAVHHYDQCGKENLEQKRLHMERSHQLFVHKHHKPWKSGMKWFERFLKEDVPSINDISVNRFLLNDIKDMPVPSHLHGRWLFELSPNPNFVPAAGSFGTGAQVHFHRECWDLLSPGRYFYRLGETGFFRPRLSPVTMFEKTL